MNNEMIQGLNMTASPQRYAGYLYYQEKRKSPGIVSLGKSYLQINNDEQPRLEKDSIDNAVYQFKRKEEHETHEDWNISFCPDIFVSCKTIGNQLHLSCSSKDKLITSDGIFESPVYHRQLVLNLIDLSVRNANRNFCLVDKKKGTTKKRSYHVLWDNMRFFLLFKESVFYPKFFQYSQEGLNQALSLIEKDQYDLFLCESDEYMGFNCHPVLRFANHNNKATISSLCHYQMKEWMKNSMFQKEFQKHHENLLSAPRFYANAEKAMAYGKQLADMIQNVLQKHYNEIRSYAEKRKTDEHKKWGIYPASRGDHHLYMTSFFPQASSVIGKEGNILIDWMDIPESQHKQAVIWISRYFMEKEIPVFLMCKELGTIS